MILLKANKSMKICFYYTILIFDLFVDLRVKSNKKLAFNLKNIAK